jgi:hypothetical protein
MWGSDGCWLTHNVSRSGKELLTRLAVLNIQQQIIVLPCKPSSALHFHAVGYNRHSSASSGNSSLRLDTSAVFLQNDAVPLQIALKENRR